MTPSADWQAAILRLLSDRQPRHVSDIVDHVRSYQASFLAVSSWLNRKTDVGELSRVAIATYTLPVTHVSP